MSPGFYTFSGLRLNSNDKAMKIIEMDGSNTRDLTNTPSYEIVDQTIENRSPIVNNQDQSSHLISP